MGNNGMFGGNYGGGWVIGKVATELTYRGYMRQTTEEDIVFDCERIQTLAEECALAVDRDGAPVGGPLDLAPIA